MSVYSATKAAADAFVRSVAREYGSAGVRINAVAPGYFASDMTSGLSEEMLNRIKRRTPLGRLVTTTEVAAGVTFLLSGAASGITGQTLVVDGGAST